MRRTASKHFSLFLLIIPLISQTIFSSATDTLNADQTIKDGETLVSSGGKFELGFFSPGNSRNRYVGMWFRNITVTTIVWVANREAPLTDNSGVLQLIPPGILVILNNTNNNTVWSTNTSRTVQNPVAQLLDSGNLVVRDGEDDRPENFLWQSFEYPTDTYLPGMSLGWNFVTGKETYLSSWRSNDDPGTGEFSFHLDPTGYPQLIIRRGLAIQNRIGPWNGIRFPGPPNPREDPTYRLSFVMDEEKVYYRSDLVDGSFVSRYTMNQSGVSQRWTWVDRTRGWVIYFSMPADICDTYRLCGASSSCNVGSSPSCGCLDERFVPRDPEGWLDIRRRSGCLVWFDELIDIRTLSPDGQVIYIRMASSEAESGSGKRREILIASLMSVMGIVLLVVGLCLFIRKKRKNDPKMRKEATNHFSSSNKLGEGGFGPVYKGMLEEGQEIAVKRLSKESRQDETKSRILDWQKRFNIINGIARGMLYLHQDSRLRIIHRDLKASNILLDSEMNPKISDFGLARSFGGNETEAKTHRVVGTYGYMSPEYAVDGLFSVKSDVFSLGVLVLEIVCGKRNRGFSHSEHSLNLLGHAWKLYKEGRSLELVDACLDDKFHSAEVVRSIQVGLLCVQQNPEDRPSMSSVVFMLGNEGDVPQAKQPGFFTERDVLAGHNSTSTNAGNSTNEVTITMPQPR
ncbi:hypothetical protein DH2020_047619 [Rehmannia glutinosa]|uniref:Receptor-like serine/threonine-protein kinase n=1 Tax=Rehmannia glutinosa TaxID=99300 RepID=A0ABR0U7W5_REHGL